MTWNKLFKWYLLSVTILAMVLLVYVNCAQAWQENAYLYYTMEQDRHHGIYEVEAPPYWDNNETYIPSYETQYRNRIHNENLRHDQIPDTGQVMRRDPNRFRNILP